MGSDIVQLLHDKTMLVTGATGYLAKIFVGKILRIQPDVKKIYLLIRAEDTDSALKRLHEEILKWTNATCFPKLEKSYVRLKKNINVVTRLAELYKPYVFFKGIFDDSNTRTLRTVAKKEGVDMDTVFNFDPRSICWEGYFMQVHFPGIVRSLQYK